MLCGMPRVDAEVAVVGGEREHRVDQRREAGEHRAALAAVRRQEERVEAELLLLALGVAVAVHDLDGAGGGDVGVQRQQGHRLLVHHDVALGVLDGQDGGVAVADEVDLGAVDLQRLVDLDGLRLLGAFGTLAVGDLGLVDARGAAVGAGRLVGAVEVLQGEAEGGQVVGRVEEVPGLEVVVLGERVGEAVALQDQLVALVLEQLAPGEGDQHHDQRDVEGEVATSRR